MFATKKKGLETRSTIEDRKVKRWSVHVGASIFRKGVESSLGSSRFGCGAVAARVKTVPRRFHRAVLNLLSIPVVNNIRPVVTTASERVHTGDAEASQRTVVCSFREQRARIMALNFPRRSWSPRHGYRKNLGNAVTRQFSIANELRGTSEFHSLATTRRKCACRSIITIVDTGYRPIFIFPPPSLPLSRSYQFAD